MIMKTKENKANDQECGRFNPRRTLQNDLVTLYLLTEGRII